MCHCCPGLYGKTQPPIKTQYNRSSLYDRYNQQLMTKSHRRNKNTGVITVPQLKKSPQSWPIHMYIRILLIVGQFLPFNLLYFCTVSLRFSVSAFPLLLRLGLFLKLREWCWSEIRDPAHATNTVKIGLVARKKRTALSGENPQAWPDERESTVAF